MANYTSTLNCISDTYIYSMGPLNVYGTSTVTRVGGANNTNYSLFAFDISSIPTDKIINRIEMYVRVNGFVSESPTVDGREYSTSLPFIVKARRLYAHTYNELESNLTFTKVYNDNETENLIKINNGLNDSSINISALSNSYAEFDINDIKRTDDNKVIVGLRLDTLYTTSSMKMQICYANFSSRQGNYTPYIIVYYSDPAPAAPTNLVPSNTVRNKYGNIILNWQNSSSQSAYTLMYATNSNFTSATTITGGNSNSYSIPANTFSDGVTVYWKVKITDNLNSDSDYSSIASFTIGSTVPSTPELISPVSTIVNSSDDTYFRWRFKDLYGYTQSKYDLQYKRGNDTETTVTITSTSLIYILNKNILSGGTYSWRIRCYNAFNEVSPYTEWTSFYSIGAPETPIITSVSNNMHPTILWTSIDQDLFRIRLYKSDVLIFDSEEQPTLTNNSYTIDDFIDNGSYKVGLQISNVYGFWSTEAFYNFTISTTKPDKPVIYGNSTKDFYTTLIIESFSSNNLIYRKGIRDKDFTLVTNLVGNTYSDFQCTYGDNLYFVRAINETGFNDSDTINVNFKFSGIILSEKNDYSKIINLWETLDSDKRKSIGIGKNQFAVHCNGRIFPILQSTPFKDHTESHEYYVSSDDFQLIYDLLSDDVLLYRNTQGYIYDAQISSPTINENEFGYVVTFNIIRLEN